MLKSKRPEVQAHDGLPPLKQRISLLYDWIELHRWTLDKIITDSMHVEYGGPRSFDFKRTCFVLDLAYRPECEGNPSIAYGVGKVNYEPTSELMKLESFKEGSDANEVTFRQFDAKHRLVDQHHAGTLNVIFFIKDYNIAAPWPVRDVPPLTPPFPMWKLGLQIFTTLGHVVRQIDDSEDVYYGRMKKQGQEWCWVRYTLEEQAQLLRTPMGI